MDPESVFSVARRAEAGPAPTRAEIAAARKREVAQAEKDAKAAERAREREARKGLADKEKEKKAAEEQAEKAKLAQQCGEYVRKYREYLSRPVFEKEMAGIPPMPQKPKPEEAKQGYDSVRTALGSSGGPERAKMMIATLFFPIVSEWHSVLARRNVLPQPLAEKNLSKMGELSLQPGFSDVMDPVANEIDIEYPWLTRTNMVTRLLGALYIVADRADRCTKDPTLLKKLNDAALGAAKPPFDGEEPR